MSLGNPDILTYLRSEAISVLGSTLAQQLPAKFESIFNVQDDPRERVQLGQMHTAGSMKKFGRGTERPQTQPFIGGVTTLTPDQYGEAIKWLLTTLADAQAKNMDLRALVEKWSASWQTSRDALAAGVIKNGASGTGYDGYALFYASHPQRSKYGDGTTIGNLNATAAAIDPTSVKAVHVAFAETMAVAENGERINNEPTHAVVTSITDMHEMLAVLLSPKIAGVANNDINTLLALGLQVLYWPAAAQASGTQYWYMVKAKGGLEFRAKERLNIDAWYDPETREYGVGPAFQASAGYSDWRCAYRQALP